MGLYLTSPTTVPVPLVHKVAPAADAAVDCAATELALAALATLALAAADSCLALTSACTAFNSTPNKGRAAINASPLSAKVVGLFLWGASGSAVIAIMLVLQLVKYTMSIAHYLY